MGVCRCEEPFTGEACDVAPGRTESFLREFPRSDAKTIATKEARVWVASALVIALTTVEPAPWTQQNGFRPCF